jgi:hypothetical protein
VLREWRILVSLLIQFQIFAQLSLAYGVQARHITFLKSTQVFNEAYAPTTTFASLPYSFSDFVDFSTVKKNSFASYAFFNLDAFNVADDHNVRAFRALYVSLNWQCHSDLPWTANLICQQLTVRPGMLQVRLQYRKKKAE